MKGLTRTLAVALEAVGICAGVVGIGLPPYFFRDWPSARKCLSLLKNTSQGALWPTLFSMAFHSSIHKPQSALPR